MNSLAKKIHVIAWFGLLLPGMLSAQSMAEFELWKKQQLGEFKQYKDEMDRQFADFLNQKWKPFDTEEGVVRDKSPKPEDIPVAKIDDRMVPLLKSQPVKPVVVIPAKKSPEVKPQPVVNIPLEFPQNTAERLISVDFLGYQFSVLDGLSSSFSEKSLQVSQVGIQRAFSDLAQSDYSTTISQLLKIKQQLMLNDWAYVSLIQHFAEKTGVSKNNQTVMSWFLLLKSSLDARVAYDTRKVYLLVASRQRLYDVAYFTYNSQKYYSVSGQKNLPLNLYSYDGKYPKKLNVSDFSLVWAVNSKENINFKQFSFSYRGKKHQLKIPYNHFTVDFLSSYPQMDIDQYFRTPLDSVTANALLSQLTVIVKDMSETEAVNLLLRFVQKSFRYETDQDQFGEENYLFIEETIFYPASDCEDRSIVFAWLVKNLLGLDVIGLDFPGHIATAVALKDPQGQVINFRHKQYSIADPTYINARAGMKMPQFKNVTPKVISIL